jgi:hypothetical protein
VCVCVCVCVSTIPFLTRKLKIKLFAWYFEWVWDLVCQLVDHDSQEHIPWYVVIRLIAHPRTHIDNMNDINVLVLKLSVKHNVIKQYIG